jgi:hypothetical protein
VISPGELGAQLPVLRNRCELPRNVELRAAKSAGSSRFLSRHLLDVS